MFSNYVTNFEVQFYAGYSYYIFVVIAGLFNLVKIAIDLALHAVNKQRLREKIASKIKRREAFEAWIELIHIEALLEVYAPDYKSDDETKAKAEDKTETPPLEIKNSIKAFAKKNAGNKKINQKMHVI